MQRHPCYPPRPEGRGLPRNLIKNRGYADKYYEDERPKRMLGIHFSSESKTVDDWKLGKYAP